MPDDERYQLTELADLAGVTPRTVRYYLSQGLLPGATQSGPATRYGAAHLARLRLIRRLQAEHLPLAEIRRRLDGLDDIVILELADDADPPHPDDSALDYVRAILGERSPHVQALGRASSMAPPMAAAPNAFAERLGRIEGPTAAPATTARPADRSQWDRVVLSADVELHIRRPLARSQNKQVDRLVTIARELLEED